MLPRFPLPILTLLLTSPFLPAQTVQHGLRVPPGFEVTEYADSKLANDIFRMTLDPRGRVVVSGRGYLRILDDANGDGRADRALDFAAGPKDGAQGLLWEGPFLYFTGDGGLRRYRAIGTGDRAAGPSELLRALKTGSEHDAHDIKRGPDGWLYVLCGNMTGISRAYAELATSPVQEPIGGCVLRFTPDLKKSEIVADGFRNPYGMDFNRDGELFTYDSDNERCVSLPWYEPTRCYHVISGGHHGWQSPQRAQSWRLPRYLCDVVAPVVDLGRGSPTGMICYRHAQFPEHYRGGLFLADWTFGRVYFLALERAGASFTCRKEVFLEAVGDNGFAPTDLVVEPRTGDLFVSIGGRGTRGAVYRIRYSKGVQPIDAATVSRLQPKPRSLDWEPTMAKELLERAAGNDALARLQALAAIRRHRGHFSDDQVAEVIRANWDHSNRYLRKATAELIATLGENARRTLKEKAETPLQQMTCCLGNLADRDDVLARAAQVVTAKAAAVEARLMAVRLLQEALGGVMARSASGTIWEGYTPRRAELAKGAAAATALRTAFPSGHDDLDRELARTLALLQDDDPGLVVKVGQRLTRSSHPVEDIHYLAVLARLRGAWPSTLTDQVAGTLLSLDDKLGKLRSNRDRHWPLRVAELYAELSRRHSGLHAALLGHADFGRPDHALFARAPGFDRTRAADIFLARSQKIADFPWNSALVELVGGLPEERALPVLRRLWDKAGLEEALLPILARRPEELDRDKFLAGLNSPQSATIALGIKALEQLPTRQDPELVLALIRCLRRLPEGKEGDVLRGQVGKFLERLTQQKLGTDKKAWSAWFATAHPERAARLGGVDGVDVAGWNRRLAQVAWPAGDAARGKAVYVKASCAACHSGAQALGPDLVGVAGRFSRDDLFTAILQPSKDISPRYRTTAVITTDGKAYQGMVIYEATDSLILQTGPDATARLAGDQVEAKRFTDISLMPAGLLDKLSDGDIADLYAYLKGLGAPAK